MVVQNLIARFIILADAIMALFVEDPGTLSANASACNAAAMYSNGLTDCGTALVAEIDTLVVGGVKFLAGALAGLAVAQP